MKQFIEKVVRAFKELDQDGALPLVMMVGGVGLVAVLFGIGWTIAYLLTLV